MCFCKHVLYLKCVPGNVKVKLIKFKRGFISDKNIDMKFANVE